MKQKNLIFRLLLVVALAVCCQSALAWWTKGNTSGGGRCSDPAGGTFWREWSYDGNNFNVDLTQQPTRNEYFAVTHPTITPAEPYVEFKVKMNGTWEKSYPQAGYNLQVYITTEQNSTERLFSRVNYAYDSKKGKVYVPKDIQWYLSQYNFMPENINKDYGVLRLVSQEGQITGHMHAYPAGDVTLVLRYYPSDKALNEKVNRIIVAPNYWFEGSADDARLKLKYVKDVEQKFSPMAEKASFKVVGPYEVEYTLPRANSFVQPTSRGQNQQQYRTITYNFPFDNGQKVTASWKGETNGTFRRGSLTEMQNCDYDISISENFSYDNMIDRLNGPVVSYNMAKTITEPNAQYQDVGGKRHPKYEMRLPGYPRATHYVATFKKWGTARVELTWEPNAKDSGGNDTDTDGKWYVYRTEVDGQGNSLSDAKYLGSVDYSTTSYEDRTIDLDKNYVYCVMFGSNSWTSKYWKADKGIIDELASVCNAVNTKLEIAMGKLTQVRSTGDENGIRIKWTSEKIEDSNVGYVIKRKVGDNGKWNEQYATVSSRDADLSFYDSEAHSASIPYYYKVAVSTHDRTFETNEVKAFYDKHSSLKALYASTGAYADKVTLEGHIDRMTTDPTQYVVMRRMKGETASDFMTVGTGSTEDTVFVYNDQTAKVGDIYEYKVVLQEKGQDQKLVTLNDMERIGFCRSTGVVSGRVTYGTGTAVEGVKVCVSPDANDKVSHTGQYALYTETASSGVAWQPDMQKFSSLFGKGKSCSLQFWIRPDASADGITPRVLSVGGAFDLNLVHNDSGYALQLKSTDYENTWKQYAVKANAYTHLTVKMKKDDAGNNMKCQVVAIADDGSSWSTDTVAVACGELKADSLSMRFALWERKTAMLLMPSRDTLTI